MNYGEFPLRPLLPCPWPHYGSTAWKTLMSRCMIHGQAHLTTVGQKWGSWSGASSPAIHNAQASLRLVRSPLSPKREFRFSASQKMVRSAMAFLASRCRGGEFSLILVYIIEIRMYTSNCVTYALYLRMYI